MTATLNTDGSVALAWTPDGDTPPNAMWCVRTTHGDRWENVYGFAVTPTNNNGVLTATLTGTRGRVCHHWDADNADSGTWDSFTTGENIGIQAHTPHAGFAGQTFGDTGWTTVTDPD